MSYLIPAIPIINKWNKVNKSIYPKTNCTAIVLFNSKLASTLGILLRTKITKFIRDLTYLNTRSLAVLVGILLGDAYLKLGGRRHSNNNNVRIAFKQSIINFPFMWAVFTELSHFCSSIPRFDKAYLKSTVPSRTGGEQKNLWPINSWNSNLSYNECIIHIIYPRR